MLAASGVAALTLSLPSCAPADENTSSGGDARVQVPAPALPEGVEWVAGKPEAPPTTLHSMGPNWELEVDVQKVPEAGRIEVVAPKSAGFKVLTEFGVRKERAGAYRLRFAKDSVPEGVSEVFVVVRLGSRAVAVGQALIQ